MTLSLPSPSTSDAPAKAEPEILLPLSSFDAVKANLAPTPDLVSPLADLRSKLVDALAIPDEMWPDGRRVQIEIDLAIVPVRVRAIVEKI